jgi:hypothetical protein
VVSRPVRCTSDQGGHQRVVFADRQREQRPVGLSDPANGITTTTPASNAAT